jgi:hypothetical protein
VHRAAHRPRPDDRSLLRAGAVDVGGAKAPASSSEAQAAGAEVLSLDARGEQGDVMRAPDVRGPVEELRGGAARRKARPVDRRRQFNSSCEYAID